MRILFGLIVNKDHFHSPFHCCHSVIQTESAPCLDPDVIPQALYPEHTCRAGLRWCFKKPGPWTLSPSCGHRRLLNVAKSLSINVLSSLPSEHTCFAFSSPSSSKKDPDTNSLCIGHWCVYSLKNHFKGETKQVSVHPWESTHQWNFISLVVFKGLMAECLGAYFYSEKDF